jgi:hypothetical protein
VAAALLLAACGHTSQKPDPLPAEAHTLVAAQDQWETSAGVVPAGTNAACPDGRMLVGAGGVAVDNDATAPGTYLMAGLEGGAPDDVTRQVNEAIAALAAERETSLRPENDNLITLLPGGELLVVRLTYIDLSQPFALPLAFNGRSGARVGLVFLRSADCGQSWTASLLDPARTAPGFGQGGAIDRSGRYDVARVGACAFPDTVFQGGFDRPEVYVDPWSPADEPVVYVAANCDGRNPAVAGPLANEAVVFRSGDGGRTWGNVADGADVAVPVWAGPRYVPSMTVTGDRRLWLMWCDIDKHEPWVQVRDESGSWSPATQVFLGEPGKAAYPCIEAGGKLGTTAVRETVPWGVAQTGDGVSMFYAGILDPASGAPSDDATAGTQVLVTGRLAADGTKATLLGVVRPEELKTGAGPEKRSTLLPSLVEVAGSRDGRTDADVALLYWLEEAGGGLRPRYAELGDSLSAPRDLDPPVGTVRPVIAAATGYQAADYMKGAAAYAAPNEVVFVLAWPVPGQDGTDVRYRVLTYRLVA